MKVPLFFIIMEKEVYLNDIKKSLELEKFDFFDEEMQIISEVFYQNGVDINSCVSFFKLILQTRNLLYKYNLHLIYEPFNSDETKDINWQCFKITDGVQTKLEVFYDSNYSFMRIEDNISAMYF